MKHILFNSWSGAFFNPGGGEVQLLNSERALINRGYQVSHYDQWQPQKEFDIFHQFSMELGVHHPVRAYKAMGKKVFISTIYWTLPSPSDFGYFYAKDLMHLADGLLTNSNAESDRLSQAFDIPRHKFFKTRNSITQDFLTLGNPSLFREKYQIEGDFILSLANIDTRKNTHSLVKACQELGLKLITIGHIRDQTYYDSFKDQYSQHLHLGPIHDPELIKSAYRACQVFALPSLCETPGISALEAASQGAKIVITQEGPTQEYFGTEHATFVNPFDFESIKFGIAHELDAKRGPELRNQIINEYTWDKTALDIEAPYNTQ